MVRSATDSKHEDATHRYWDVRNCMAGQTCCICTCTQGGGASCWAYPKHTSRSASGTGSKTKRTTAASIDSVGLESTVRGAAGGTGLILQLHDHFRHSERGCAHRGRVIRAYVVVEKVLAHATDRRARSPLFRFVHSCEPRLAATLLISILRLSRLGGFSGDQVRAAHRRLSVQQSVVLFAVRLTSRDEHVA